MPKKSILLVEHEVDLRDILGDCLREMGDWQVAASSSIKEAINFCETSRPDVILIDASTPEDDALLRVEQLKKYSLAQAVPIFLLSAKASWFTLKEFNQMGFSGAIDKPFNPATLSSQLSQLMTLRKPGV